MQTLLTNITKFALFAQLGAGEISKELLNACLKPLPKRQSGNGSLCSDLNSVKVGQGGGEGEGWA